MIATPIFEKVEEEKPSAYPHKRRLEAYFRGSLKNPVSPYVVAETIRGIVESEIWQLRYPAGPDAIPLLEARAHISDEDWVASGAASDEDWAERIERGMGVKLEW